MGNPVEENLPRGRLGALNRVLLRLPIEQDVQFRNLGNPATISFPVELNRKLHVYSLALRRERNRYEQARAQDAN